MRKTISIILLFAALESKGQAFMSESRAFMNDANGRPLYMQVNYNIEGSPFFPGDYRFATIITPNGTNYQNVKVKINLLENTILYKTLEGEEMVANTPIQAILFTEIVEGKKMDVLFKKGYQPIDKQDENSFYQVIDSGTVAILKQIRVSFDDRKAYGNASITRVFDSKEYYYVCFEGNQLHKLEKGRDAIIAVLPSKKEQVSRFITDKKLSCKTLADWQQVIKYYRSL